MKITILYSGGLDSRILYHYAITKYSDAEVSCIYYRHGAESEAAELALLPDFVQIRTVEWLSDEIRPLAKTSDPFATAIYIPGRNLVFACLAASQELSDEIWMGTMYDEDNEQATDKNEFFRSKTSELLTYVLSPFKEKVILRFPFVEEEFTKLDAIEWALENGLSKDDIKRTTSCWHNIEGIPCGICKQCLKRFLIFEILGIREEYKIRPSESPEQQERLRQYVKKYRDGTCNIDERTVVELYIKAIKANVLRLRSASVIRRATGFMK